MSKQGYVKLYRSLAENEIYQLPPLYTRIFLRLILESNHTDVEIPYKKNGEVTKKIIKRGERLTSIRQISEWVGWFERGIFKKPNPKLVKEVLDYLCKNDMIEIYNKGNRTETHYKVCNYKAYQDKKDKKVTPKKRPRNAQETELKRLAPQNNNEEECKRMIKNNIYNELINSYTENKELRKAIYDFADMRKSIKKKMTVHALELMLKKLDKFNYNDTDKIKVLENSIMNSWQGVFELKGENNNKNRKVAKFWD
ncbi:MAG: hypothetical protein ACTSPI_10275 [Candidatus Heimdallarchaeaceae archaeon]